jgi:hypothetical protein
MTMAMPSPIDVVNEDNKIAYEISFGSQYFAGLFYEDYLAFTKVDARYNEININNPNAQILLPEMNLTLNLKQDEAGTWTGPGEVTFKDISVSAIDGSNTLISEARFGMKFEELSFEELLDLRETKQALNESSVLDKASDSWAHVLASYNLFFDMVGSIWDGFGVNVQIKDYRSTRPPIPGSPAGELKLDNINFSLGMKGLTKKATDIELKAAFDRLSLAPETESSSKTTPENFSLNILFKQFPYEKIVHLGYETLSSFSSAPGQARLNILSTILTFPRLLTDSGSHIHLKNFLIGNQLYDIKMDGKMRADIEAALGVTAQSRLDVAGMDMFIEEMTKQLEMYETLLIENEEDEELKEKAKSLREMIATLSILKLTGEKSVQENTNRTLYSYNLELNKDGSILLNDTDLSVFINSDDVP